MKTFEEFRFSIPHNKVKLGYKYTPKTKEELAKAIEAEIEEQGPNADLNCIDTSKITDMSHLFNIDEYDYAESFNGDINGWDVSNTKTMNCMFFGAENFDGDISEWNVSNITNMESMFCGAKNFNGDINEWNVSNVENMEFMFSYAENFNNDISKWNVSNVTNMRYMFCHAKCFNQDISKWNISKVNDKFSMFDNCPIKEKYKPKFK